MIQLRKTSTLAALALATVLPLTAQAQPLDRSGTIIATTAVGAATGAMIGQQNNQTAQGMLLGGVLGSVVGLILVDSQPQPTQVVHYKHHAPKTRQVIVHQHEVAKRPSTHQPHKVIARQHEARERGYKQHDRVAHQYETHERGHESHERVARHHEVQPRQYGHSKRYDRDLAINRSYEYHDRGYRQWQHR